MISDMDSADLVGMEISDNNLGFILDDDDLTGHDIDEMIQCQEFLQSHDTSIIENEHFLNFIALNRLHFDGCPCDRQEKSEQNRLAREYYRKLKPAAQQKLAAEFTECISSFIREMNVPDDDVGEE